MQIQEEDTLSEGDSDGIGPEGWDDVLSAWMSNAGLLVSHPEHEDQIEAR